MAIVSSPKQIFWALICTSIALTFLITTIAAFFMPTPPSELFLAVATSLFSFAAIPLFVMALKDFKHGLRRAYAVLCIGIILYGMGQLQFPLFEIIDATAWVESGAVVLPYILSISCLFFGMRHFGKLVGLKSLWLSPWLAYGSGIAIAVLLGFAIQSDQAIVLQLEFFLGAILFFSVMIALRIRSMTASRYRKALTFMAASLGMLVFAALHHTFTALVLGGEHWYVTSGFTLWPSLAAAILFMQVGYSFTTIRLSESTESASASPINVITYVASFASNPPAIDKSLDTVRDITSISTSGDSTLSKQQEVALAGVYMELEEYLVKHEPLQKFTQESLREMVRTRFQFNQNTKSAFWALFSE